MKATAKESFQLNPIGCGDCFWKIENGLKELPGVTDVKVDMGKIIFEVTFDPTKLNRDRILKKIEDMGFRLKGKHYPTAGIWESIRLAISRAKAAKEAKRSKPA